MDTSAVLRERCFAQIKLAIVGDLMIHFKKSEERLRAVAYISLIHAENELQNIEAPR